MESSSQLFTFQIIYSLVVHMKFLLHLLFDFVSSVFFFSAFIESQIVDNASSQSSQDPQTSQQGQYNYADNNTDELTWELAEFEII